MLRIKANAVHAGPSPLLQELKPTWQLLKVKEILISPNNNSLIAQETVVMDVMGELDKLPSNGLQITVLLTKPLIHMYISYSEVLKKTARQVDC
jgi:hypothetical protein